ncbi:MAG: AAA family ATPase [Lewinellaceae bacterium]|nr:AAA family ATPase [Lewinellaceae bacterium]
MTRGLVLGKFMPLHTGHVGLITFAAQHCDHLLVLVCAEAQEPIAGDIRLGWVQQAVANLPQVEVTLLTYRDADLPNTSASSQAVSRLWADFIHRQYGNFQVVFSSEPYGEYLAAYLHCRHQAYDPPRREYPVAASLIRTHPLRYWDYLPAGVRPYFTRKIALLGTESTGKSTLTQHLADHFGGVAVPEMARDIVAHTDQVTPRDLQDIAFAQARAIEEALTRGVPLIFIDTTLLITQAYSRFLFDEALSVPTWIEEVNQCHCYLFLTATAPYVQDGTRLTEAQRNQLDSFHRQEALRAGITLVEISGNTWHARTDEAIARVNDYLAPLL